MSNLEEEYLKMNRLTQMLIYYLINLKPNDQKFGKFLVGIIFGDSLKKIYEKQGIVECKFEEKQQFLEIVNSDIHSLNHLKYNSDSMNLNELPNSSIKENLSQPSNQRQPMMAFPSTNRQNPENLFPNDNFRSLRSSNRKSGSSLHFTQNTFGQKQATNIICKFEPVQESSNYINPLSSQNELDVNPQIENYPCERPTLCEEDFLMTTKDYIDFTGLPESYFDHWDYLRQKVEHYQGRLMHFYDLLNNLAHERIKNNRSRERNQRRYDRIPPRYEDSYDSQSSDQILSKRPNPDFEGRGEFDENNRRDFNDRFY